MPDDGAAKIDRVAEPDPRRAKRDKSVGDKSKPAARLAANANAANAEAELAKPAAVGTWFNELTRARVLILANFRT